MKEEMKGLYIAIILSLAVILATNLLFPKKQEVGDVIAESMPPAAEIEAAAAQTPAVDEHAVSVAEILAAGQRVKINNPAVEGSILRRGAQFDYLQLKRYKQSVAANSDNVELLMPARSATPYYAEFGWLQQSGNLKLPDSSCLWTLKGGELTSQSPVVLEWNNGQGLKFVRKISVDENYMFTIEQMVENNTGRDVELYPYGLLSRRIPKDRTFARTVHEGMVGVLDSTLKEIKYDSFKDDKKTETYTSDGGWIGFSDHYWLSALILDNNTESRVKFSKTNEDTYQADYIGRPLKITAGTVGTSTARLFAGAKEIRLLDAYEKELGIAKFDLAVDFGWYYFLTKPFFYFLDFLYRLIGNMGWAILLFAALLRLAMFPVANKSFESMSKMKKVQPKIQELQEKFKDDKVKLQTEMMNLYRKEKINPASGCLPMFIQIPVFFSLYKVLNIAIEIRQAPFVGWIKDLSEPDPLTVSVITHLPLPAFLDIGVWPILMGLTMYLQQKLNPKPANKDQARMFALMPLLFMFMLGHFASGLVIYWTLSNILSIAQQRVIMKKMGVD